MFTQIAIHIGTTETTDARMATHRLPSGAPFETLRLNVGESEVVIFANADQLLGFARAVEQAAWIWQAERDGVSPEAVRAVMDTANDRVSLR